MKRRKFTSSFKKKIAIEALKENRTINEIAAANELHPVQVSKWKKEAIDNLESVFEGNQDKKPTQDFQKREDDLHRKIGQLTVELDWVKKKLNA